MSLSLIHQCRLSLKNDFFVYSNLLLKDLCFRFFYFIPDIFSNVSLLFSYAFANSCETLGGQGHRQKLMLFRHRPLDSISCSLFSIVMIQSMA